MTESVRDCWKMNIQEIEPARYICNIRKLALLFPITAKKPVHFR